MLSSFAFAIALLWFWSLLVISPNLPVIMQHYSVNILWTKLGTGMKFTHQKSRGTAANLECASCKYLKLAMYANLFLMVKWENSVVPKCCTRQRIIERWRLEVNNSDWTGDDGGASILTSGLAFASALTSVRSNDISWSTTVDHHKFCVSWLWTG